MNFPVRLGDFHNFGKATERISEVLIFKPRPLIWEWLFFSEDSDFRSEILHALSYTNSVIFSGIGSLVFPDFSLNRTSGHVQVFQPTDVLKINDGAVNTVGTLLALAVYFGISDLHQANVGFSMKNDQFSAVFLDVEMVLSDLIFPSQTGLLPADEKDRDNYGLIRVFNQASIIPDAQFVARLIHSYVMAFEALEAAKPRIAEFDRQLRDMLIRVIARDTRDYQNGSPLMRYTIAEAEQLHRGDIPYFCRRFRDNDLYVYERNGGLRRVKEQGILENIPPLINSMTDVCPRFEDGLKYGALEILSFLKSQFRIREMAGCYKSICFEVSVSEISIHYKDKFAVSAVD